MRILTKRSKQDLFIQNRINQHQQLNGQLLKYKLPQIVSKKSYSPIQQYLSKKNVKANIYIKSKSDYQSEQQKVSCVKISIPATDPINLFKKLANIIQFTNSSVSFLQNDDLQIVDEPMKSLNYQGEAYKQKISFLNSIFGGCGFLIKQKDVLIAEGQKSRINYVFFTNCPHHPISLCCRANILLKSLPNKTTMVCTICRRQMIKFVPRDLKQYFLNKNKSKSSHLSKQLSKLPSQQQNGLKKNSTNGQEKVNQRPKALTRLQRSSQGKKTESNNHQSYSRNTVSKQNQNHSKFQHGVSRLSKDNSRKIQVNDFIDSYTHQLQNSVEQQRMKINFSLLIASGRYKKLRINEGVNSLQKVYPQSIQKYYMKNIGSRKY